MGTVQPAFFFSYSFHLTMFVCLCAIQIILICWFFFSIFAVVVIAVVVLMSQVSREKKTDGHKISIRGEKKCSQKMQLFLAAKTM